MVRSKLTELTLHICVGRGYNRRYHEVYNLEGYEGKGLPKRVLF